MAPNIPDLWETQSDAHRLYESFLCQLSLHDQHARVIEVCQQIRRFAASGPGLDAAAFTSRWAIDAHLAMRNCAAARQELEDQERRQYGETLDLPQEARNSPRFYDFMNLYVPLHFLEGQYAAGIRLLETALGVWLELPEPTSSHLLAYVCNGVDKPENHRQVTLSHFYRQLGRPLSDWQDWPAFVRGLEDDWFRQTGIERESLASNPDQLPEFARRIEQIRSHTGGASTLPARTSSQPFQAQLLTLFPELLERRD